MDSDKSELRWGVAQRLEFIEFRLFWEGRVNRSDLMEQFGLSVNQASADLNRYIGFAPDNMVYDKSARTYVRGPDYSAQFLKPDASRYLAQLRSLADGIMDSDDTWIAELPSYDAAPTGSMVLDGTPGHSVRPTKSSRTSCYRASSRRAELKPVQSPMQPMLTGKSMSRLRLAPTLNCPKARRK